MSSDKSKEKGIASSHSHEYVEWITSLKEKFQQAQIKAAIKVNSTLLEFYWELGADIVEKQKEAQWGTGFLKQVSADLMKEFPTIKGFSISNLKHIRNWWHTYNCKWITTCNPIETEKGQQLAAQKLKQLVTQIPWGQNLVIISKCKSTEEALFYLYKCQEYGWSRAVLTLQIESGLYRREGKAITNFKQFLPAPDSDLAQQLLKDPYNFEFLTLTKEFKEKELEAGLVEHITQFLIELGSGFAYMGKQVKLTVGDQDFYIDLLFYHTRLRCYVVIELKATEFQPEHTGKLNFYLAAVDGELKHEHDSPTIGILLCKSKNKTVVEYALKNVNAPMGVSEYEITESLPDNLKSVLPSVEEIEAEIGGGENE